MRTLTLTTGLPLALLASALLTGCGHSDTAAHPNTTNGITSAAASTSTTATDPNATASTQAVALVNRYFQTLSRLDSDYSVPVAAADEVATGDLVSMITADVTVRRSQGITITGAITVLDTKVTTVQVTPAPATAEVRACLDIAGRDAKYPDGTSANAANRMPKVLDVLTVVNPAWPDSTGWRVSVDSIKRDRHSEACDG